MRSTPSLPGPDQPRGAEVLIALAMAVGTTSLLTGWARDLAIARPRGALVACTAWSAWAALVGTAIARTTRSSATRGVAAFVAVGWGVTAASWLADTAARWWPNRSSLDAWPLDAPWFAASVIVPIFEEVAKAIGVLLLLSTMPTWAGLRAGVRLGMFVGLGFAVIEGWAYSMDGIVDGRDVGRDIVHELWVRGVETLPFGHVTFSALTGLAVAALLAGPSRVRRSRAIAVSSFVLAVAAHGLHNARWAVPLAPLAIIAALAAVLVGAAAIAPHLARRRHRRDASTIDDSTTGEPSHERA